MSTALASATRFSYTADEVRQRVRANGEKADERFSRHVVVRRPNALMFTDSGGDSDAALWYDGSHLTLASKRLKVWARGPMPATLDEAMDFVSSEYAIQFPTADLLYSSPYNALMTSDTTGGWVGTDTIDGATCDHLAYKQTVVDWELWLTANGRTLPKRIRITYKTEAGQPIADVTFRDWNPNEAVSDATFAAHVPVDYRRIKIMRHLTVSDGTLDAAPDTANPPSSPATPD